MTVNTIIGIDAATKPDKTGLALAKRSGEDDPWRIKCATLAETGKADQSDPWRKAILEIKKWLGEPNEPALIAIDAPLGWPDGLKLALALHEAGTPVAGAMDLVFTRQTDREIRDRLKEPLDVGADRIARTAHASLRFLHELRAETRRRLPLAWDACLRESSVIEVYPGATLVAHEIPASYSLKIKGKKDKRSYSYKADGDAGKMARGCLINNERLREHLSFDGFVSHMTEHDHVLDAVLCVLAGVDLLEGRAVKPWDMAQARREGWIWAPAGLLTESKRCLRQS